MNLYKALSRRADSQGPVRIGLIGAGKFGSMFLAQARRTRGFQVVGIADLTIERARDALVQTGWPEPQIKVAQSTGQINEAAAGGRIAITEDAESLIAADLDVVVECTGAVQAGTRHALAAIEAGRHVVMVTVEADALVGPVLRRRADRAGVVYSLAYGDQPALVCEMVDWARTCGFEVVAAGKGTKYLPQYHYATPETVFEHYGFSAEQIARGDLNAKMFNSFLDGTKSAIEMAAISNATGLIPQQEGLRFPPAGIDDLAEVLKPKSDGGCLTRSGTVEVVSCLNRDGSPVPRDLRWGVYVTVKASTDYVRQCFEQYGLLTDSSGWYAALYRPSHLVGLELGVSIASVVLHQEPTGAPNALVADVVACAKRDLSVGETLDGEGGQCIYGRLLSARDSLQRRALPAGLTAGARLVRAVSKDAPLTYDDVKLAEGGVAATLRKELEKETLAAFGK